MQRKQRQNLNRENKIEKEQAKKRKIKQQKADQEKDKIRHYRPKTGVRKIDQKEKELNKIWDTSIEFYLKDKYRLLEYKGYDEEMLEHNNALKTPSESEKKADNVEDDPRNKLLQDDFQEIESEGEIYVGMKGYKGSMYVPPAFSSNYQISIWKIDDFGVVKIQDKYFTPETKRASDPKFPGFNLQLSLDEQTMLMIEKDMEKHRDLLVISLDLYSLEILSEILVDTVDETIINETYYRRRAAETQNTGPYHTGEYVPKITSWNRGKHVLAMVTSSLIG